MKEIVFASKNKYKLKEIESLFEMQFISQNIKISPIDLYGDFVEPEEPYSTYYENAVYKSKYYGELLNKNALSDDSGLCVVALNDFPGVKTKDFVKECGSFDEAFLKLESMLKNKLIDEINKSTGFDIASGNNLIGDSNIENVKHKKFIKNDEGKIFYRAYYKAVVSLFLVKTKEFITGEGEQYGFLSFPANGKNIFGFDPVFIPDGYNKTFGELGIVIKNENSHRSNALKDLMKKFVLKFNTDLINF